MKAMCSQDMRDVPFCLVINGSLINGSTSMDKNSEGLASLKTSLRWINQVIIATSSESIRCKIKNGKNCFDFTKI